MSKTFGDEMELTTEQRTNLKRTLIAIAVLVLVSVGSFSAGRFSAPLEVKTLEVEKVVYQSLMTEDVTRGMSFTKVEQRTVYKNVVTTVVETPDVGTITTVSDNSIEKFGASETGTATETESRTETIVVEREVIKEKTVTLQPDWSVGVLVGTSFDVLDKPFLPIAGPLIVGLEAERRIVGGFYLGVWLTNDSAGGKGTLKF